MSETSGARPSIQAPTLEGLRYSFVWEDHHLLEDALAIGPEDDVISVTSGGQNVLNLAICGPRSVTAVDLNPAQSALLELEIAATRTLTYPQFVVFLEVTPSPADSDPSKRRNRSDLYGHVRKALPHTAREFWDARPEDVENGVLWSGRLNRYVRRFQTEHLSAVHSPETVDELFAPRPLEAQREFFTRHFAIPKLHDRFVQYFGRESMQRHGRDPRQFAYVETDEVGEQFWRRFVRACGDMPTASNFYLRRFLTGRLGSLVSGPPFLRPEFFEALRNAVDRIRVVTDEMGTVVARAAEGAFSKANLSDIFEYLSPEETESLLRALGERIRKGGRIAWWSLLVPRDRPEALSGLLRSRTEQAQGLFLQDRAWFYRSFHVEEIIG